MEADLTIHLHTKYLVNDQYEEIDEENLTLIQAGLTHFLSQLAEMGHLVIQSLKQVHVPNNFEKEVQLFGRIVNIDEEQPIQGIEQSLAVTVFYTNEAGEEEQALFLRYEGLEALFSPTDEYAEASKQVKYAIYHELARIDQYTTQKLADDAKRNLLPSLLGKLSLHTWQKYYASRKAASMFAPGDLGIESLHGVLNWFYDRTVYHKNNHQGNYHHLLRSIYEDMGYVLFIAAAIHGNIDGLQASEENKKELRSQIRLLFEESYWMTHFEELGNELRTLFASYPHWQNGSELEKINEIILRTMNDFGVFPEDAKEQIFIRVK